MNTDVNVGWGPVTIVGIVTAVTSGLFAIAAFLTTLTGSLPASVSDKYGFWLATAAGIVSAVAQGIVGASRVFFAKQKVNLVSNIAFANPAAVTADVGDSVVTYEDDPVISDTNVTPPVTPVS
jgi:hypothetical protein